MDRPLSAPRLGIVVTHPDFSPAVDPERDSVPLVAALRRRGADAEMTVWHDPAVRWEEFDLVVLRSPWDYTMRPAEFSAWLERVDGLARVLNDPALVRWNMDKRYLTELEAAGVAVIPTSYHEDASTLAAALAAAPGPAATTGAGVVVKPSVGAGARRTGLFGRGDPAAGRLGRELLDAGDTVMVQEEIPDLTAGREKALYTLEGEVTHAIAKGALLAPGGGLRGGVYQEDPRLVEWTEPEQRFAAQVLSAVAEVTGLPAPLYARIDTVDTAEHGIVLLEAELFEPTFNLHLTPQVTETFAAAILARL